MRVQVLTDQDQVWHARWCSYVRAVFSRADFERWIEWGEWNADYRAIALTMDDQIVAGAGLTQMRLLIDGVETRAWQLGAVGCLPALRGNGHARRVLDVALSLCADEPVLLFANPRVTDLYPRFGLQARAEAIFTADCSVAPGGDRATVLALTQPSARALVHRLAEFGVPTTMRFGARGHGRILSWYVANSFARPLLQLDADTVVAASVEDGVLYIDDILALHPFDLRAALARLIDQPIRQVRFGFTPELWWPTASVVGVDPEPFLYVRGLHPHAPHKFPLMAQT